MKFLKIEKAKRLEDSIAMFTRPEPFLEEEWELQNEDGTKHENSDEFTSACRDILKANKLIETVLKK